MGKKYAVETSYEDINATIKAEEMIGVVDEKGAVESAHGNRAPIGEP